MKTPAAIGPSAESRMVLRQWAKNVRAVPPDALMQAALGDILDDAASAIEGLQRENRALFDGYQGCIADRARLAKENAALRSGRWPRGALWRIVTGLLLIAIGCGLAGAGAALIVSGCG